MGKWTRSIVALVCALVMPFAAAGGDKTAADDGKLSWPSPWKPGVTLTYDEQYESVDKRGDTVMRITASDVVDVATGRTSSGGLAQTWTGRDPKFSTEGLPAEMAPMIKAAAESFKDLSVNVVLAAEGHYESISNLDTLLPRYRTAIERMLAAVPMPADTQQAKVLKDGMARIVDMLTAPALVEQELAKLPAAYNFVAGGGLAVGTEYEYEDESASPLGAGTIKRRNVITMTPAAPGEGTMALRWLIEPDTDATMAMVAQFVRQVAGDQAKDAEITKTLEQLRKEAAFRTEVNYLVDTRTGIVERMELVEIKRVGNKDETERTVLTRRR